ncbi:acyl-CoA dehydrogenase family protein [Paraburkholderia oxyphila]|uniref:acyl-CoA dehydrogenase family protein n=1 Tax=Paraburkholderia oxyphila TaxID=614212 RepID=UPI00047FB65D|nr:acyl-CoA dehydrogenase family protein [Paraburkholderia oxyphila]
MDFNFSSEDELFRQEIRQFFKENAPADISRRWRVGVHPPARDDIRRWQRILHDRGWGAPHLPVKFGGTDWSALRKHIFMEELYNADAMDYSWQSTHMVAPVIIAFGSDWQKERFLAPILSGDEFWCQGFSEPNAGSDLAGLKTTAVLDGDEYVVNGQKIWTSDATISDWGFFLVKTDTTVKPQRGISFLLVKMDTPGITVRPIVSIEGGRGLNEVFLENVRVPKAHLVGEPGMGWTYAKYLLEKERTTSAFLYFNKRELQRAKDIAAEEMVDGVRLIDTPWFARKVADIEVDLIALEWSVLRILAEEKSERNLDAVVSALKISGSEMQQRVTQLQMDALGPRVMRFEDHAESDVEPLVDDCWPDYVGGRTSSYLITRASTIYGGAREVQKNIIAKLAFGL